MKILIVGAGGQLGRALIDAGAGHDLLPLTSSELDITELGQVRKVTAAHCPEAIINCAAWTDVDRAEAEPLAAFRVNSLGPRNLALAAAGLGIPLLHVSSDYVFDGSGERPLHEYDTPNPLSAYGHSKLAGELAIAGIHPLHYIVRTSWLYHVDPPTRRNFPRVMISLADREMVHVVSD